MAALSLGLAVVIGGVILTARRSDKPEVSIHFIGFTNGPQGQVQACFALSRHATGNPEPMYLYQIRGTKEYGDEASPMPASSYPFPFRPQVTVDPPKYVRHFRLEVMVGSVTWKNRLAGSGMIKGTFLSRLIPDAWNHPSIGVYSNQWTLNPTFAINQAAPPQSPPSVHGTPRVSMAPADRP